MKGETWAVIPIIVATIIFAILVVALVRIKKKKKGVSEKLHEKTDATDSSPKKEKGKDSKNMETGKTLELLGIQAKMIGFKAVIRTGLFGGNEELRLKRDGITLDVSIDSDGEVKIEPVVPVWFQIVCAFVVMIILSIVMSLMADQTVLVKGGWIVVLAGILLASPIYKSIKRKALDAAIESVSHLL